LRQFARLNNPRVGLTVSRNGNRETELLLVDNLTSDFEQLFDVHLCQPVGEAIKASV